jgi:hypothetical protein
MEVPADELRWFIRTLDERSRAARAKLRERSYAQPDKRVA